PQVFETSAELVARAEWNTLLPRQVRPADMVVLNLPAAGTGTGTTTGGSTTTGNRKALALLAPSGSFPAGTLNLRTGLTSSSLFRLDPSLSVDKVVDAIEVSRVYFTEAA